MIRTAYRSLSAVVVLTIIFGGVYPVVVTVVANVAFSHEAHGSLIHRNGTLVGSRLDGQEFTSSRYFHSRPSATSPAYNPTYSTFANFGPTSPQLKDQVTKALAAVVRTEGPYSPGLAAAGVPVDAVTTSGSGLDPDISPAYARLQAPRIAAVRHLPQSRVLALIGASTDGRAFRFLGEPGVNVLALNLALDREQ